jgi:dTDP-4-dehydrorhamnose reductase
MGGNDVVSTVQPVIVGAGGMLGQHLGEVLPETYPETVCATRDEIDITDYWTMRWELERLHASVVINCAAYTDVDGSEAHEERARLVNVDGAGNLARACHAVGARLIHLSTDFVFDGRSERPYTEEDETAPLSAYGRSKLDGERAVAAEAPDHLIVRVSWLYGPHGKNFVSAILGAARAGKPLRVVSDQHGTPTYTGDLSRALTALVAIRAQGVLHFAQTGVCSRLDYAREALRQAGLGDVVVEAITSDTLARPAHRPAYSALDTARYLALTGEAPRRWQETLADYLSAVGSGEAGGAA